MVKRKILFIVIVLIISTLSLSAQWFSLGVKGGSNSFISLNYENCAYSDVSTNWLNGAHVGVYMRLGRTWYVQPEALYNYNKHGFYYNDVNQRYNIHTVDVPILLGVHLVNVRLFKMRFMVGPKFCLHIGILVDEVFEGMLKTRDTRLALDCGLGFDIWRITLDFRYNLMPNIFKMQDVDGDPVNTGVSQYIQASVGFRLLGDNKRK